MLQVGDSAPAFVLPDADMELFDSASVSGKHVVIYFYPKDGSPGCIREAIDFSDREEEFDRLDCRVIGISMDDCLSHAEFRDKHGVSVLLLADPEGEVCRMFGVLHDKHRDGEEDCSARLCVARSTFVMDRKGIVRHALHGVNPRGHAVEILGLVRQLFSCRESAA